MPSLAMLMSAEKLIGCKAIQLISKPHHPVAWSKPSYLVVLYTVLDVDEPDNLQLLG